MFMVSVITPYLRIHRLSKELKKIDCFGLGEFAEIRLRSHWYGKFFSYVIARSIVFQRVSVLAIILVRKGAVDDW